MIDLISFIYYESWKTYKISDVNTQPATGIDKARHTGQLNNWILWRNTTIWYKSEHGCNVIKTAETSILFSERVNVAKDPKSTGEGIPYIGDMLWKKVWSSRVSAKVLNGFYGVYKHSEIRLVNCDLTALSADRLLAHCAFKKYHHCPSFPLLSCQTTSHLSILSYSQ